MTSTGAQNQGSGEESKERGGVKNKEPSLK
jgi:hypothetical protein